MNDKEEAKKRGIEILEGLLGHNIEQTGEASPERLRPPHDTDKKKTPPNSGAVVFTK